jgi:hypothetical protein
MLLNKLDIVLPFLPVDRDTGIQILWGDRNARELTVDRWDL